MGTDVIKVYARLKPEQDRNHIMNYRVHRRPKDHIDEDFLVLQGPIKVEEYIDHRPESWNFSFYQIIDEKANQREVFENIARPVIQSVLDGYNGTVFAYGQTGSGKTYSITGEGISNDSQGIIPRTLCYLFDVVKMHPENVYSVDVAYLEIYNENGYDLLDRKQVQQSMRLEDLPRVSIQEDEKGRLHLKNLTFHNIKSKDQAMELFVLGDSRRITADTPMNAQSSRSHCIFTIVVSIKQLGASRYKKAKMHLVDLAGSERIYKCSINGTVLNEAKYINLSLHYLEQVIVCLSQDSTSHVPYRNCLLTAVLRDSLGGNCVTTMLATLSVSSLNFQETISTCRFAQRVALVRNDAKLIMEHDLDSENTLLKLENEKLRKQVEELSMQNENFKNTLSLEENNDISKKLEYYKNLVDQRDKEISILIDLLKKAKEKKDKPDINKGRNKLSLQEEPECNITDSDTNEIKSKIKTKGKESIAERLSKTSKLLKASSKIESTMSDSNNEVDMIKEDKNLSSNGFTEESSKPENIPDVKIQKVNKMVKESMDNKMSPVALDTNKMNNQSPKLITNAALYKSSVVNDNQIEKQDLRASVEYNKSNHDFDKNLGLKRNHNQIEKQDLKANVEYDKGNHDFDKNLGLKRNHNQIEKQDLKANVEYDKGNHDFDKNLGLKRNHNQIEKQDLKPSGEYDKGNHDYDKNLVLKGNHNQMEKQDLKATVEYNKSNHDFDKNLVLKRNHNQIEKQDLKASVEYNKGNYDYDKNLVLKGNHNQMEKQDLKPSVEYNKGNHDYDKNLVLKGNHNQMEKQDLKPSVEYNKGNHDYDKNLVLKGNHNQMEKQDLKPSGEYDKGNNDFDKNLGLKGNHNQIEKQDLKVSGECDNDNIDFDKSLPLTGDPEIDEEIVAFYKAKRTGGIY